MLRHIFGLVIIVGFAGCSRVAETQAPSAPAAVRFAIAGDPATLDPLLARPDANSVEEQLARLVFEPFIDIDPSGQAVPVLLERIPTVRNRDLSRDGRTITYRLRRSVHWSDGAPVTAQDVAFTLRAILDPRNPVRSRAGYDLIDRIIVPDPYTIVVHLRRPWAPAVASFFSYGTAPQFVLPAHLLGREQNLATSRFGAQPVGDGPYRLSAWHRGDRLTYVANASYWRGAPRLKRIDVAVVGDPSTNLTLLRSGALTWNLIAPSQQSALSGSTEIRYRSVSLASVAAVVFNLRHPPLDDARVRRALAFAIDRRAISAKITLGRYPVVDTAQPLGSWARDPHVAEPGYDPSAADRLLDAAGWQRGAGGLRRKHNATLALTYVQFPESQTGVRVATMIQSELAARGITVTIKSITNAQLFLPASQGGALASGAFDLAYVPFPMGADPDDAFLLRCDGPSNYMRWCDRDVDGWEQDALTTTDRTKRHALYARIEQRVARDVPLLYLFDPSYLYAYDRRLHGFAPNAFSPTWNAENWTLR